MIVLPITGTTVTKLYVPRLCKPIQDCDGYSALDLMTACECGHNETAAVLLDHQAKSGHVLSSISWS